MTGRQPEEEQLPAEERPVADQSFHPRTGSSAAHATSWVASGTTRDSELETVRACRVRLARLVEPSDTAGLLLLAAMGPETLWRAVVELEAPTPALHSILRQAAHEAAPGARVPDLGARFAAWRARLPVPEDDVEARHARSIGAWTVVPEDPDWPPQLADLGLQQPIVLWGRGDRCLLPALRRSVAVVGSRNASAYGAAVTREISRELAVAGWCVVSGGAYGIDAVAHGAALEAGPERGATTAVLACGVDRFYPAANAELLARTCERGLVLSEVPLGCAPTRYRFLQRNRLIAALTRATVVTEAAWRSGALNTARHAAGLSRDVAAVPGDVLVGGSAGCHRLIRDDNAVLVGSGSEVLELVGPLGNTAARGQEERRAQTSHRATDGLDPHLLRLFDALPLHRDADPSHLCRVSGLSPAQVLTGLVSLQERGLATDSLLGWRRVGSDHGRTIRGDSGTRP
ncbi:DNA-protecting protein DprA [Kocuria tytonicola]|uniref:DNA-protecting protein DprA n=1 Tax=Kocuria tytonicola TaxID=2055946 RepID=A0A3L9L7P6_9MICC|nr:DNA-processing protein DprA [Kocuria tytonicola]RLY94745.1 DNA-protecting protein DprA [Kocuria tytonicola]